MYNCKECITLYSTNNKQSGYILFLYLSTLYKSINETSITTPKMAIRKEPFTQQEFDCMSSSNKYYYRKHRPDLLTFLLFLKEMDISTINVLFIKLN